MGQDTDQYATNGDQDRTSRPSGKRVSVYEAAEILGVTVDAIRKRVQRGTIPHERDEAGRVWVLLDAASTLQDNDQDGYRTTRGDELVESLQGQVEYLKGVVATRDEEIRRRDHIIAGLVERLPLQIEAPTTPAPRDAPQTATEEPEGTDTPNTGAVPQERSERRSWLHRFFFGE